MVAKGLHNGLNVQTQFFFFHGDKYLKRDGFSYFAIARPH